MTIHRAKTGLALFGCFIVACVVLAETPQKDDPATEDREVVSSKVAHRPAAASVNFGKELGLPFPSLGTLGARIGAARKAADPVALAHAASELAVAEKVSGKKAS